MKKPKIFLRDLLFISVLAFIFNACEPDETPKQFPPPTSCPGAETVEYAGETYKTVQMGDQCWMAKNLNVGVQLDSRAEATDNDTIEKYCYNNDSSYCAKFGGLYQWDELMQYTEEKGAQGICPSGWHIPTTEDFAILYNYVEGYSGYLLKNDTSWGDNLNEVQNTCMDCIALTGFDLLPSGNFYLFSLTEFRFNGQKSFFWTSNATMVSLDASYFSFVYHRTHRYNCYSVRCIKDE